MISVDVSLHLKTCDDVHQAVWVVALIEENFIRLVLWEMQLGESKKENSFGG